MRQFDLKSAKIVVACIRSQSLQDPAVSNLPPEKPRQKHEKQIDGAEGTPGSRFLLQMDIKNSEDT